MQGRAGYSERLAHLSRRELEVAVDRLPPRSRALLQRTEIDHADHKAVARELQLSVRQFYRARATAVRSVIAAATRSEPSDFRQPIFVPVAIRMLFVRVAGAVSRSDEAALSSAIVALQAAHTALGDDLALVADVLLAVGDATLARLRGNSARATSRLRDVARSAKALSLRTRVAACAQYGLAAMLAAAHERGTAGETDTVVKLANDVLSIATDVRDTSLQIEAEALLANALLALPYHIDEAYARAMASVQRCTGRMQPLLLIRCLRTLAAALAERNLHENALSLRDAMQPLASAVLGELDRNDHMSWSAGLEFQCGSAARAADIAQSVRNRARKNGRSWIAATIVRANALFAQGFFEPASLLAQQSYDASQRSSSPLLTGEALLSCARIKFAVNERSEAGALIAAALPLLDRSALVSVQRSAYRLSFDITADPLHRILARAYTPPTP